MSIEQTLERIAVALEKLAGNAPMPGVAPVAETPKKATRRVKDTGLAAQQAAAEADAVPGADTPVAPVVPDVMAESAIKNGAELRAQAQQYIASADKVGPDMVGKLVTFIQSVAKIFNPTEPKLIKIPDAKVPEAAAMIASWCAKEGIKV